MEAAVATIEDIRQIVDGGGVFRHHNGKIIISKLPDGYYVLSKRYKNGRIATWCSKSFSNIIVVMQTVGG